MEIARLTDISVEIASVDLGALSAAALYELQRHFASTARKYRHAFGAVKKSVRRGAEQIARQLAGEAERRGRPEPRPPAALLTLNFKRVESAGYLMAFVAGLEELYVSERSKIPQQGEMERSILDVRGIGFEASKFCRLVAAAICETTVEV